jgi:hypothetical protein
MHEKFETKKLAMSLGEGKTAARRTYVRGRRDFSGTNVRSHIRFTDNILAILWTWHA